MKQIAGILGWLVGSAIAAGAAEAPLRAVATVGMVADLVREVGGAAVQVDTLMGAGVDPHLYKPTRSDVAALLQADAIFYAGLLLEGKMADTLARVARNGKPVQAVSEALEPAYLLGGAGGHHDPHVWMDVSAWQRAAEAVQAALIRSRPAERAMFTGRAERYRAQLTALDDYARRCLATIPPERRVLVTAHDAFSYFGRAYAVEVRGIQGISTESEAGLEDLNRLVDLLVSRRIPAVFVESSVADKNVRALVEGARARGHAVRVGGSLFSDAMGPAGTYEGTYIGMIDHNVTLITRALGGQAPERGLNGKLGGSP